VYNALRHQCRPERDDRTLIGQLYLALGTNLGDRQGNLQRAIDVLGEWVAVEAISSLYETAPWGNTSQPAFLNLCLAGKTTLEPLSLLREIKEAEVALGRRPAERWGPRLIDIDILLYDDTVRQSELLTLPHPGLHERAFVLAPLAEIAPALQDPRTGQTIAELLDGVDREGVNRIEEVVLRRPTRLAWGAKTYVMGILNVTPDSFSGDGLIEDEGWVESAVRQGQAFAAAGADVLDVGGESTRPGSRPVSEEEEMRRAVPAIHALRRAVAVPISVDTYRSSVALAALEAGADWINDVWGLRMDDQLGRVASEANSPIVLMHNRSKPKDARQEERLGGRYVGVEYDDLIADIRRELMDSVSLARAAGIRDAQIILDPGIGFGKTVPQNIQLIRELRAIKELGFPMLVGPSRKSFIGYTLNLPPQDRAEGTAATVALSIDRGADIVRVHDVQMMVRVARMADRIVRA
jgi:dihydropteroate synthase/2-amino-4-hydroxy-6-hydroxymethyldihydropteridine diphosphokinase